MMLSRPLPALLIASLSLAACGGDEAPPAPPARPVKTTVVGDGAPAGERAFSGVTRAAQQSQLSFQVSGTVATVPAEIGRRVERGEVLATLDPSDLQLREQQADAGLESARTQVSRSRSQVAQAEAGLRRARTDARLARAEYERLRGLYADDLVSLSRYDAAAATAASAADAVSTAEASLEAARSGVEAAEAGVRSAEGQAGLADRQLAYARLRSPVDGTVADVRIEAGELVGPGQSVVSVSATGGVYEVAIDVPETVIARIGEGDTAGVALSTRPGDIFAGVVTEVGVTPLPGKSAFPVTVRLADAPDDLRTGVAATTTFTFGEPGRGARADRPLAVAPEAVAADQRGTYVYVVVPANGDDPTGRPARAVRTSSSSGTADAQPPSERGGDAPADYRVERRAVTTGTLDARGLAIASGLRPGDRVVTAGVDKLTDGDAVRLLDPR